MTIHSFTILVLMLCSHVAIAQGSSPVAETDETDFPSQQYQKSRDISWALKYEANGIIRDNDYFFNRFGLFNEVRASKRVSLNVGARLYRQSRLLFQDVLTEAEKKAAWSWELSIEPRFNLSGNRNTFLGNYAGLRAQVETGYRFAEPFYKVLATLGTQRFFYTSIFNNIDNAVDANIGLGISYQKNRGLRPSFQINMMQGAILSDIFRRYSPDNMPPDRINEFQAKKNQQFLVKIDLFNTVTKADERDVVGEMRIGYEQKIGKSPFALNIEGVVTPSLLKNNLILRGDREVSKSSGTRLGLSIEPRWYYDLKRRMAKGLSGNNLLGSYLSVEFLYQNQHIQKYFNNGSKTVYDAQSLTFTPLWGIQQQFSKRIFYDFKLGWGIRTVETLNKPYFSSFESNIYADILIGLAFGR